ncbi:MAG TPA: hypothetical protein V6D00_01675 [Pantanalinema sp.]
MLEDLTGAQMAETGDWDEVLAALNDAKEDVILELPWQHPDAAPDRHELVLKRITGDRAVYYNASSPLSQAVGTPLPGNAVLPERRVEGPGLESMPLDALRRLFEEGEGAALLPTKRHPR